MFNLKYVNYCEIDSHASKSYAAIHGVSEDANLGDITKVDINNLPQITCLVGGSPCQDLSQAGYMRGTECVCNACGHAYNPLNVPKEERSRCPQCGSHGITRTRSALLTYYLDILAYTKPEFTIYENVSNLLNKNFKSTFDLFIKEVEDCGYNVYYSKINAKHYFPQNRDRVIVVGIRKDLDNGMFSFPTPPSEIPSIKDLLDDNSALFNETDSSILVDPKISPYVRKNMSEYLNDIVNSDKNIFHIPCESGFQDNQVGIKYTPALRAGNPSTIVLDTYDMPGGKKHYIKRLTPIEAFRFMGFDDEDLHKAKNAGVSDNQLFKQAGNSIVVEVVYAVLKELCKAMPYLFEDVRLLHLFSGIGAFEKAFKRVIDEANSTDDTRNIT